MKRILTLAIAPLILICLVRAVWAAADRNVPADPRPDAPGRQTAYVATDVYTLSLPLIFSSAEYGTTDPTEYGVNFISAADAPADQARYQRAISTGAAWNRWPLYWYDVEQREGVFEWSAADAVVQADLAQGFLTELILMGTPGFYATAGNASVPSPKVGHRPAERWGPMSGEVSFSTASTSPVGLYDPTFDDGTDLPGPGKGINPANKWARFVYSAVERYGPMGVSHYEVWNEPDYSFFWNGTAEGYARLLKVAYLAARQADSAAQILFGGLANFEQPNFLADTLAVFATDTMAPTYDWFFDLLATHSYSHAWESWLYVYRAGRTLSNYGLKKEIWLNESGSPAWDDYPGPVWDPHSAYRSTMLEGAAYVIQSALYAQYAGATVVFHFQLYDDCGNDPPGTDFPPHNGELCGLPEYPICGGDAFGLFTNRPDAACYTQHPQPDTPRPVFDAYRVLTDHAQGLEPLWRQRPGGGDPYNGPQEWIAFYRPATGERVLGLWARFGDPQTAMVTATGAGALLIDQTGTVTPLTPVGGTYTLQLGPATNQNLPHAPDVYAIGGPPLLLVETDTRPPQAVATVPSPIVSPAFPVTWSGEDLGSGVADYDIWVNVDGGPMSLWLTNTTETSASYTGEPGRTYGFAAVGRDRAGNQGGQPTEPQAETTVATSQAYLPLVMKAFS